MGGHIPFVGQPKVYLELLEFERPKYKFYWLWTWLGWLWHTIWRVGGHLKLQMCMWGSIKVSQGSRWGVGRPLGGGCARSGFPTCKSSLTFQQGKGLQLDVLRIPVPRAALRLLRLLFQRPLGKRIDPIDERRRRHCKLRPQNTTRTIYNTRTIPNQSALHRLDNRCVKKISRRTFWAASLPTDRRRGA